MNADDEVPKAAVETEVTRGEQDDILEDYPQSEKEQVKKKVRSKLAPGTVKHDASQAAAKPISARIEELAQPTRRRMLITLQEKASTLSPIFVDNLIKSIETKSCLTPEEAARVLRRRKRKTKKVTGFPPAMRKWMKEIARMDATTLDRDAMMCQYLMAERFVKSILEYRCRTQRKDFRDIAHVVLKRLASLNGCMDVRNGDDRATQQLRLLADILACWIVDVLIEVAETHKEALEEYCRKRQMKMMEADDNDDDKTDSEIEDWKQVKNVRKEERKEKRKKYEAEKNEEENNPKKDTVNEETRVEKEVEKEVENEEKNVESDEIEKETNIEKKEESEETRDTEKEKNEEKSRNETGLEE